MGVVTCDRCGKGDKVSRGGFRFNRLGPKQTYWCNRCHHRFSMPTARDSPVCYENGKAYLPRDGRFIKWVRVPELDAKRLK